MRNTGKKLLHHASGKSYNSKREIGCQLNTLLKNKTGCKISTKRCNPKPRSHVKTIGAILSRKRASKFSTNGTRDNYMSGKRIRKTAHHGPSDTNSSEMLFTSRLFGGKSSLPSCKAHVENADGDIGAQKTDKRRKLKRRKEKVEQDEASRLQRRTRYLLIKMKLEQNLIDAYSGEGWNGQSREKIKPEKELLRAKKQILKCKLGIRDTIRQLDLLSTEGCIEESVIAPDGSVFHEHIFCAKCKSRDAFPDNDIILCDGTCNCAFHQKCLEPPLATENIPPGDQGWFCKFCECKMEILEAMNAHLGTHFPMNSNWQEIFKEEAVLPDGESDSQNHEEEWPSDDSEDDDYDPERNEKSCSCSGAGTEVNMSDDASTSSRLLWSSGDDASLQSGRLANDDPINGESAQGRRRQRRDVDYKKLHDEIFGKDVPENEQISEDEDWGPGRTKRREKESDAANTLMTLCESEDGCLNVVHMGSKNKLPSVSQDRKPIFRIPPNAVEKLRQVFSKNELPSRAVKENLSKQLGVASEKVNKWFKNARYTALKIRKAENTKQPHSTASIPIESGAEIGNSRPANRLASEDKCYFLTSETGVRIPKKLRKVHRRKNPKSITTPSKKKKHKKFRGALLTNINEVSIGFSNAINLEKHISSSKRKTTSEKRVNPKCRIGTSNISVMKNNEQLYLVEMERLCSLEDKLDKLKKALLRISNDKKHANETHLDEPHVIYVPVAEVREKL